MKHTRFVLVVFLLMTLTLGFLSGNCTLVDSSNETDKSAHAYVPFSINVDPDNITISRDEDLVFLIGIQPEEGFNSTVELELEISFVGYNLSMNMFPLIPPFPRMQEATIELPPSARAGMAKGVLRATCEDYVVVNSIHITLLGVDEDVAVHSQTESQASFKVTLTANKLTAKLGEDIGYYARITSDDGFSGGLSLAVEYSSPNMNQTIDHGLVYLPYEDQWYRTTPSYYEPGDLYVKLRATNGKYSFEDTVKIRVIQDYRTPLINFFNFIWETYLRLLHMKLGISDELNDPGMYQDIQDARLRTENPYYGDKSTMIYHHASCTEYVHIERTNRVFFSSKVDAENSGYQACSICKP